MTSEKLYLKLPTAPPDAHSVPLRNAESSFERYNRIEEIYNELKVMKSNRYKYFKRYSKMTSGLQTTSIALGTLATAEATVGVVTSLTVVGIPIGVILVGLGGFSGLIAGLLIPISNHCEKRS